MLEINIPEKTKQKINRYIDKLKSECSDDLVSVIIYGSATSNEFVDKHSNINFLVVLKNSGLTSLKKFSRTARKFPFFEPLFLTEDYITNSTDIFPIEFLDMQENYLLVYGKDVLKGLHIDMRNLRFQCEQELKIKLINLRQLYLNSNTDNFILRQALLNNFTSILHISRNILRLKGKPVVYKKGSIIKGLSELLPIDINLWENLLSAKNKNIKIVNLDAERFFISFTKELEKIVDYVDKL